MSEAEAIKGDVKPQVAMNLFYLHKQSMKNLLRMGEFKYGGKKSEGYKHYRQIVMDVIYSQLNQILKLFEDAKLIEDCGCGASIDKREGYQPCQHCHGCGYRNSKYLNDAMAFAEGWTPDHQEMIRKFIHEEAAKQNITVEEFLYPVK